MSHCDPLDRLLAAQAGWRAVETTVLLEHRLDLSAEPGVLGSPLARRLLPLPPGVVAAAGYPELPAQPGRRVSIGEFIDQAKPLGGSCSHRKRKPFGLRKVRCRQPENILLRPQLAILLAEPVELGALLTAEQALISRAWLPTIDAGLAH